MDMVIRVQIVDTRLFAFHIALISLIKNVWKRLFCFGSKIRTSGIFVWQPVNSTQTRWEMCFTRLFQLNTSYVNSVPRPKQVTGLVSLRPSHNLDLKALAKNDKRKFFTSSLKWGWRTWKLAAEWRPSKRQHYGERSECREES